MKIKAIKSKRKSYSSSISKYRNRRLTARIRGIGTLNFKKLILTAITVTVLLVSTVWILKNVMFVSNVECNFESRECSPYIMSDINNVEKTNYIFYKINLSKALDGNEFIKSYIISYHIFNKVKVEVVEKRAIIAITSDLFDSYSEVDDTGITLSIVENTSLPILKVENKLTSVGEKIDERLLFATQILYSLKNHTVKSAEIRGESMVLGLENGLKVIFPLAGDKEVLLGSFVLITSRLKEGDQTPKIDTGKDVGEIDLRFKNPVLR